MGQADLAHTTSCMHTSTAHPPSDLLHIRCPWIVDVAVCAAWVWPDLVGEPGGWVMPVLAQGNQHRTSRSIASGWGFGTFCGVMSSRRGLNPLHGVCVSWAWLTEPTAGKVVPCVTQARPPLHPFTVPVDSTRAGGVKAKLKVGASSNITPCISAEVGAYVEVCLPIKGCDVSPFLCSTAGICHVCAHAATSKGCAVANGAVVYISVCSCLQHDATCSIHESVQQQSESHAAK